jgi:hypothetical protein
MYPLFREKLNLYRRYPSWSRSECIFIHVPKAAGTSVSMALYGRTLGHYSANEIQDKFPKLFQRSFVFSLVRNPWDRTLSAYRFAKVGRTESMGVHNPEQYKVPGFDSFESFVLDWLPRQKLATSDYIFREQRDFLVDSKGDICVDYVGRVEGIGESLEYVSKNLGRNIVAGHSNSTSDKKNNFRSQYVNSEMIDVVASIYGSDITMFDYRFED